MQRRSQLLTSPAQTVSFPLTSMSNCSTKTQSLGRPVIHTNKQQQNRKKNFTWMRMRASVRDPGASGRISRATKRFASADLWFLLREPGHTPSAALPTFAACSKPLVPLIGAAL